MTSGALGRGKAWEAEVEDLHARYEAQGRCAWARNEPHKVRQRGVTDPEERVRAAEQARRGRGMADYTVAVRGAVFLVEVKEHRAATWPLSQVSEHQALRFDAFHRQGVDAFVLLRLSGRVYLLPWAALSGAWHRARMPGVPRGQTAFTPSRDRWGLALPSPDYLDAAVGLLSRRGA